MLRRKTSWTITAATLAMAYASATALAQEQPNPAPDDAPVPAKAPVAPAETIVEAEAAEPRTPLMQLFDNGGFGEQLDEYGISIGGWVSGSVTWSLLDDPAGNEIPGRAFDFEHADPTLNQMGFTVIRGVDHTKPWDVGFTFEHIFGADARFTASNGMDFQTGLNPENQFDITQAYGEVVLPVGNGLVIKAGKWITPIGYEYVNPTLNALYSHTYLFGIIPFSHTGVMGTYHFDDTKSLGIAVARGWEQSLKDNNSALEAVFTWAHTPSDRYTYAISGSLGPQLDDNNGNYRFVIDYWSDLAISDAFSLGFNIDYRYDSGDASDGDGANTFGAAVYGKYVVNQFATLVTRGEWFNDTQRSEGFDSNIYALTVGVNVTPFPGDSVGQFFRLRPELRYDYATEPLFDGGTEHDVLTFAIEGVFQF
jgi:hypothetical protein